MLSFHLNGVADRRVFGTPSEGQSGGATPSANVLPDGTVVLPTLTVYANAPDYDNGNDDDDSSSTGSQSGKYSGLTWSVTQSDVNDVVVSATGQTLAKPIFVRTSSEYVSIYRTALEARFETAVQETIDIITDGWGDPLGMSRSNIGFYDREWAETLITAFEAIHDYARANGFSISKEGIAQLNSLKSIPDEYFDAIDALNAGKSIAEAQMIAELGGGHMFEDGFVFVGDNGNYGSFVEATAGDVLVSSGIDVSDGIVVIDPLMEGLPSFALPGRDGIDGFTSKDPGFHDYHVVADAPSNLTGSRGLAAVEHALAWNPTPGHDAPATIQGTLNRVGMISPFFWENDNFVFSHIIENPNPYESDIIVNYTVEGDHIFEEGWVMQFARLDPHDGSIEIVFYGEGNSWYQGLPVLEAVADAAVKPIWTENAEEVFDMALETLHLYD